MLLLFRKSMSNSKSKNKKRDWPIGNLPYFRLISRA
jgi:hypothetical protein